MKKIFVCILMAFILTATASCDSDTYADGGNLVCLESEYRDYTIYYHKETRVMYLRGYSVDSPFVVMVDKDGKPLLYTENKEKN